MVLNSVIVVKVANLSANVCQSIACNPERLSSEQVLDLIFCLPLQQLGRLALCLWTFFCFPPPSSDSSSSSYNNNNNTSYYYSSDSSDSSTSYYDPQIHSHSD